MNKENYFYISSNENIKRCSFLLFHGIRFDFINRLESIFQTGYILPSNEVKRSFKSYDGTDKYLYINNDSDENCNMGKYVSLMPYVDDLEFCVFVRENIFFAINGLIPTIKTTHVSYDDYCDLKNTEDNGKYYSYAFNEYFALSKISLKDVVYIGIDSCYFKGNYESTVEEVINLINAYNIEIPFIDERTYNEIYCLKGKKLIKR